MWSEEDKLFLKNNYSTTRTEEIAKILNRETSSIYSMAHKLKLDNKVKKEIDWNFVYEQYVVKRKTIKEIGEILDVSWKTISKKMPKSWKRVAPDISYDCLFDLYVIKKMSYKSIGEVFGVSAATIKDRINKFGIKPHSTSETLKKDIDIDLVIELYNQGLSCVKIATKLGVSHSIVSDRLKERGIVLRKQCEYVSGEKSSTWKGGTSSESELVRSSKEYRRWREAVFARDNYTCQKCGDNKGGNLNAHHIVNFSENKKLRFELSNGITLCNKCHSPNIKGSFHNIYGTKNNTKEQLDEFLAS